MSAQLVFYCLGELELTNEEGDVAVRPFAIQGNLLSLSLGAPDDHRLTFAVTKVVDEMSGFSERPRYRLDLAEDLLFGSKESADALRARHPPRWNRDPSRLK